MKPFFVIASACFLAASCSVPSFGGGSSDAYCACADGSWKYWPKGQKCWEILEEQIGKQGYYGELEITKSPAYFSESCRSEP